MTEKLVEFRWVLRPIIPGITYDKVLQVRHRRVWVSDINGGVGTHPFADLTEWEDVPTVDEEN